MADFPWLSFAALDVELRAYRDTPSIDNLNHLHLQASVAYAKLSTFVMEQNAQNWEAET